MSVGLRRLYRTQRLLYNHAPIINSVNSCLAYIIRHYIESEALHYIILYYITE